MACRGFVAFMSWKLGSEVVCLDVLAQVMKELDAEILHGRLKQKI